MSMPTGVFTDLTKNYYGIDPTSQKQEDILASEVLWRTFLTQVAAKDQPYFDIISSSDEVAVEQALISLASAYMSPLTDAAKTDLRLLAHALAAQRGATLSDLTSSDPQKVLALLTSLISSEVSQDDPFLTTLLPSITDDIATKNAENQKLYLDYLANQLNTQRLSEASNALSPTEATLRHLPYTLFDILYTLLKTMTDAQILEANAAFPIIGKKQEYVDMMKKIFMYQGKGELVSHYGIIFTFIQDPTTGKITMAPAYQMGTEGGVLTRPIFNEDPSKYSLGYANITLQDIFDYVYTNAVYPPIPAEPPKITPSSTFELDSSIWWSDSLYFKNRCVISVSKDPDTGEFTVSVSFDQPTTTGSTSWTSTQQYVYTQKFIPTSNQTAETMVMDALKSTFYSAYADARAAEWVHLDSTNPTTTTDTNEFVLQSVLPELKIQWGFHKYGSDLGADTLPNVENEDLTTLMSSVMKFRSQTNQVLNSYLQSINSQIALLNDKLDSQTQMQEAASSQRSQTVNIVQAILRQLQDLIAAIYK